MKIIVSSKCMKIFLKRILARWNDAEEKIIHVEGEIFKMPELATSAFLSVFSKPGKFEVPMKRRTIKKLYDLCSLISDQPITLNFSYNSITVNPVIL